MRSFWSNGVWRACRPLRTAACAAVHGGDPCALRTRMMSASARTCARVCAVWLSCAISAACTAYDDALLDVRSAAVTAQAGAPARASGLDAGAAIGTRSLAGSTTAISDAAPAGCSAEPSSDYCSRLPELAAEPAIDGRVDCGLALQPIGAATWNGSGSMPAVQAHYAAAYAAAGLYVYVQVRGSLGAPHPPEASVFCGDAVEIYVDANPEMDDAGTYDSEGTMQFVIAAPAAAAGDAEAPVDAWRFVQGNSQGAWITERVKAQRVEGGYDVEALIVAADLGLWDWSPRQGVSFSVGVDVAGGAADPGLRCGLLLGQFFLRVADDADETCRGEPWCDVRAFCSVAGSD
jgi:hypothetical protein